MDLNYFICTLGEAAQHKNKHGKFTNVNDLIEEQVTEYPHHPAVGFYIPLQDAVESWQTQILTFTQAFHGSCVFAQRISDSIQIPEKRTVALLCPSSPDFLFTWLGLMRLGHPVLLIAPQCSPTAIHELCKQCECTTLFHDDLYTDLAHNASQTAKDNGREISSHQLPFPDEDVFDVIKDKVWSAPRTDDIKPQDVAYLHHTSGTSSGIPKPIPQTHKAGAGVYARFDGSKGATFTTTPLYHGGIADLFRAWTSHALIWLFPGKELPITAVNVVKCLEFSRKSHSPPVRYFSSVPYVLQMMAEDASGLAQLQSMDMVGVGGAALPVEVGNHLVSKDVNLVSRFGSAECGFLMSSYRDFANDKEWQYLRPSPNVDSIRFESRDEGLAELVILPAWPHMSKTNRDDGSFATADLFQPHPKIEGAWKYHSRADSQLTLITGKKFDPSPLESAIAASTSWLSDVLLFGNGKPYPGALLFRSKATANVSDEDLVASLASKVEELNKESQSHARIPRNMLIPMPYGADTLEKSSKGTILRGKAEERYAAEIEKAYSKVLPSTSKISDEDVESWILETVKSVVAPSNTSTEQLKPDTDLFAYGADSVACVQIRHAVSQLLPKDSESLPLTIVQDSGTVGKLAHIVIDIRQGKQPAIKSNNDIHRTMQQLVDEYSELHVPERSVNGDGIHTPPPSSHRPGKTVLLTGPTGSLGSHLLDQLLLSPQVSHIYLLLRGASEQASYERVRKALESRVFEIPADFDSRVSIHTCSLSKPLLGLTQDTYTALAQEVDIIYHLAWSVDFVLPLNGFKQHFTGLRSLLELSLAHSKTSESDQPAHMIFCSSTASVSSWPTLHPDQPIPESIISEPKASGSIGYSQSKWVAENICHAASLQCPSLQVDVIRVGQVSGDIVHGIWNKSEAYPLMLSTMKHTGCLPDLENEDLTWIPVDRAAEAFVQLMEKQRERSMGLEVAHVLNHFDPPSWSQICSWLREVEKFDLVPADEWLGRLESMQKSESPRGKDHPALKLLEFWKTAYGGRADGSKKVRTKFDTSRTFEAMPLLSDLRPIDKAYILKLWSWIKENI